MKIVSILGLAAWMLWGCQKTKPMVIEEVSLNHSTISIGNETLSSYQFFTGELKDLTPAEGVVPYQLNSPLFSDYAYKKRFIKFPKGTSAYYHATEVFEFPEGTVLIKNFYYPADFRKPEENIRIVETRLLILENGKWKTLPYIWNDEQTEAFLDVAGKNIPVEWTHYDGSKKQVLYSVPNMNQCKSCHMQADKIVPIGPLARQLNGDMNGKNQLENLAALGHLHNLPALDQVPKLVAYDNEKAALNDRARAWLEVNCAHCHRPDGPAKTSGLHLLADVNNTYELGVGKAPVAAGRGSGGRKFDIVPGNPDASILYYRINSTDPGVMMPELGKKLIHEEGAALIKQWIEKMQSQ
jgi:uncharacterized repeat protein (TIGR03806 family)